MRAQAGFFSGRTGNDGKQENTGLWLRSKRYEGSDALIQSPRLELGLHALGAGQIAGSSFRKGRYQLVYGAREFELGQACFNAVPHQCNL